MYSKNRYDMWRNKINARSGQVFDFLASDYVLCPLLFIATVVPGVMMLTGIKAIPHLISNSISSSVIAYSWVILILVGGCCMLASIVFRRRYPTVGWITRASGLHSIVLGISIYGIGAWSSFGFVAGVVTISICFIAIILLLKEWHQTRRVLRTLTYKYDSEGNLRGQSDEQ